jgi:hypothetical protein
MKKKDKKKKNKKKMMKRLLMIVLLLICGCTIYIVAANKPDTLSIEQKGLIIKLSNASKYAVDSCLYSDSVYRRFDTITLPESEDSLTKEMNECLKECSQIFKKVDYKQRGLESEKEPTKASADNHSLIYAILVLLLLLFAFLWIYERNVVSKKGGEKYKDDLDKKSIELQKMKDENKKLTDQLEQSRKGKVKLQEELDKMKRESATEKTPSDVNECVKNTVKEEIPDVKKTNEPPMESHIPSRMYANVDVNESSLLFTKVQENIGKRSAFEINTQKKTFVIINDEDIYSQLLQNPNSSGVMNGCEVMGTFSKGKSVSVTPGHVRKEGNGWKIVEKCKIVIE